MALVELAEDIILVSNGTDEFNILEGPKDCGFEGVGGRPLDCPNNPYRHKDSYRPEVCAKCPSEPQAYVLTEQRDSLPSVYKDFLKERFLTLNEPQSISAPLP